MVVAVAVKTTRWDGRTVRTRRCSRRRREWKRKRNRRRRRRRTRTRRRRRPSGSAPYRGLRRRWRRARIRRTGSSGSVRQELCSRRRRRRRRGRSMHTLRGHEAAHWSDRGPARCWSKRTRRSVATSRAHRGQRRGRGRDPYRLMPAAERERKRSAPGDRLVPPRTWAGPRRYTHRQNAVFFVPGMIALVWWGGGGGALRRELPCPYAKGQCPA